MALPKQIQERAAALAAFEKQQDEQDSPAAVPEQDEPQRDEQEKEPEVVSQEGSGEQGQELQKEVKEDNAGSEDGATDVWEERYKHLNGKYQSEVPRLHQELKELRAAMQQMHQQMQEAQKAKPAPEPEPPASLITDEDVDAYGADLVDLQRRVAQEVMQKELSKLRQESEQLKQQLTQVKGSTFEARLHQAVPDFAEINQDPRWVAWLNEFDPMIQGPRRQVAQAAYMREDANAVKTYVDLFKQSIGASASPAPAQQVKQSKQAELQKQVQPARVASTAAPASAGQQNRVYSQREMATGYERIRTLISRGKLEEASALEAELSAAYMEGRVSG
jgi:hypothetical protein